MIKVSREEDKYHLRFRNGSKHIIRVWHYGRFQDRICYRGVKIEYQLCV